MARSFLFEAKGSWKWIARNNKALPTIRRYNGDMALVLREILSDPYMSDEQQEAAIFLWMIRQEAKRELP